jgi:hypothetical protein
VWVDIDGGQDVIHAATRPAGGSFTAAVALSTTSDGDDPRVAVDPEGDADAVWKQTQNGQELVQAATRPIGGVWSAPATVTNK